jgi:hypothetical protein
MSHDCLPAWKKGDEISPEQKRRFLTEFFFGSKLKMLPNRAFKGEKAVV